MRLICSIVILATIAVGTWGAETKPAAERRLRIICFGAHPDDCEVEASGSAALWAARGHRVKFVAVSNGDIGHWREAGGPLAQRRKTEVEAAAKILGIETQVLDNHDGEVMPTLENRRAIVRLIREWQADLVITHRPNDYHPDHRYTAILIQDAAYMVTVPFFCPDVPALRDNPVFAYYPDGFDKPYPFTPDVVVAIDPVIEKKLDAVMCMVSQFSEGGCGGGPDTVPSHPDKKAKYLEQTRAWWRNRDKGQADRFRKQLVEFYGEQRGAQARYAEAFEICEYGRRPGREELKKLFPIAD
jgi:LmbE family N-acetylglucosaminyl deacetylase